MGAALRVGFVGLGHMGLPMANRLLGAPGRLTVFDRDAAAATPVVDQGARMASSLGHLADLADVVCVMVDGEDEVEAAMEEILPRARPGTRVLLHSTIRPETAVRHAARAAEGGVEVLDAAVCGGPVGAEQGRLAILVGGSADGFAVVRPVLERLGDLVVHAGRPGAGACAKLARSLLQYVAFSAAGEAARLAEAAGVDPALLGRVVRHSDTVTGGPGAVLWRETATPLDPADPWWHALEPVRTQGETDLALALSLGAALGVHTPLAELAAQRLATDLGLPGR